MAAQSEKTTDEFDPKDEDSWNFGPLSRRESIKLLEKDHTNGTFLIRESESEPGALVLSVRQDEQIRHYRITRTEVHGHVEFTIGDQKFKDLPSMLEFYKTHYLESAALSHPAPSKLCIELPAKAVVLRTRIPHPYDVDQLKLHEGDIVTVTKINSNGHWEGEINGLTGSFPFTHVKFLDNW